MSPAAPGSTESAVDAAEAIRRVAAGTAWLLDVREDHEWRAGHASGAHHIPMGTLGARLDEIPSDEPILVICHSGARSQLVTDALRRADYRAANVVGGMEAWQQLGGAAVQSGQSEGSQER